MAFPQTRALLAGRRNEEDKLWQSGEAPNLKNRGRFYPLVDPYLATPFASSPYKPLAIPFIGENISRPPKLSPVSSTPLGHNLPRGEVAPVDTQSLAQQPRYDRDVIIRCHSRPHHEQRVQLGMNRKPYVAPEIVA